MAENNPPWPPSMPKPSPEITLPPRASIENIFTMEQVASPNQTTSFCNFFAENDPDDGYSSLSELLPGDMSSLNHNFEPTGGGGGGSGEFMFQQNRPGGGVRGVAAAGNWLSENFFFDAGI